MGFLHHYRMDGIKSQVPVALPPLPKLRPRPGHLMPAGNGVNKIPITNTYATTTENMEPTVSKLLMKSEFSRLGALQVWST